MRKRMLGVALATLTLGGCATSPEVTELSLAEGESGQLIDCGGFRQSMNDCIAAANAACDGDYEVLGSTGRKWGDHSGDAALLNAYDQAMVVRCRSAQDD